MVFRIVSHVASLLTWLYLVQLLHCCCHDKDDSWNCARSLTPEELPREGDLEGEWYEMGRTYFPYEYKQSCNVFNFSYIATDDQGQWTMVDGQRRDAVMLIGLGESGMIQFHQRSVICFRQNSPFSVLFKSDFLIGLSRESGVNANPKKVGKGKVLLPKHKKEIL